MYDSHINVAVSQERYDVFFSYLRLVASARQESLVNDAIKPISRRRQKRLIPTFPEGISVNITNV